VKTPLLESCLLGNGHVQFGGGESEKYRPRQLAGFLSHIDRPRIQVWSGIEEFSTAKAPEPLP